MTKLSVGVIFGSRSVEHDVSIVTASQVMRALDPARYAVTPVYIDREGRWFTGEALRHLQTFEQENVATVAGVSETVLAPSSALPGLVTPPLSGRLRKNTFQKLDVAFPVVHGSHGEDGTLQGLCELANLPT
ncbi:MAG: hypothetical protein HC915_06825 [Anaerolineae bacterium]|nr:hypothetical protein [Anaerolineae bacterium]